MKSTLKGIALICLVFGGVVVSTNVLFAYPGDANEHCSAIRNADLNDADRELRDRQEDCGVNSLCLAQADSWHRDRVDEIWEQFYWCMDTMPPIGGPTW